MQVHDLIKQKSYEKIAYTLRRHWITFVPKILLFLILASVPFIVYFLTANAIPDIGSSPRLYPILIIVGSIYFLSIYLFFFAEFVDFYLDIWIVTNDRIVDIEQFGLFSRTISELDLFQIQDITTDVHGLFSTLFKYGDITIQTASTNESIIFYQVPNPNFIRQEILRLAHIDRKFHFLQPEHVTDVKKNN